MADISNINAQAELERCGIIYEYASEDEIKVCCPFHSDKSPSFFINVGSKLCKCQTAGCEKATDFVGYLARQLQTTRAVVLEDLGSRYALDDTKVINPETVERYHAAIWLESSAWHRNELYKRGLTDDDIRQYRLGEYQGRITIPVPNAGGAYVNIRKYLPGAPGKDKMRNAKGRGEVRIFPPDQLRFKQILITGGECKAIVAARQLNKFGIGAVCATCGEGNWEHSLTEQLRDKERVYVCLDTDVAGQTAAAQRCLQVCRVADWVANIELPLDKDKYPKGDINDFVASENGQLKPLLDAAQQFIPEARQEYADDTPPEDLELTEAIHADKTAKRIALRAVVSAMDTSPYVVPKDLEIICDRDQKECAICPVFLDNNSTFKIPAESPAILELVNAHKIGQLEVVKAACGIPRSCKVCMFEASTYYNVEDARISPQLEITNRSADRVMQPALCIGNGMELNESYNLVGRMFPHPKTQQSTLLISKYETTSDALSSYQPDNLEDYSIFWPREWSVEAIEEKLSHIYSDFEANVTRIFQRRDLHLATDLMYHSPLFFQFDGKIRKGWVEGLICGDTSQGKSEVACGSDGNGGLMAHYNLGQRVVCKNATVAGLLGGLQQMGSRWFVSWGVIPTHDKRAVIMEELSGMSQEVLSKLTDMRSSGIAEIPKIEKRRTHARTRLLMISNARSEMRLSQYNFGIEMIKELVGALEDIRRFDFAVLVSSTEINESELNVLQTNRPQVAHTYTGDLCRSLVLWGWTRNREQVVFTDEATETILANATMLCTTFTDAIPLVDKGSMRLKLARLAASLAVRLFSCSEDYQTLIVHAAHVEYVSQWLLRMYSSAVFGYLDYTKAIQLTQTLVDPDIVKHGINETPFPSDLVKQLLAKNKIDVTDLQDWTSWDRDNATRLLSLFVRKHALVRDGKAYRKSSKFIHFLKEMLEENKFNDRPPHIGEEY